MMRNIENQNIVLAQIKEREGETFSCDESELTQSFQKESQNTSFGLKILSLLGGVLATLTFLGFLAISGVYESQMFILFLGFIFVGVAVGVSTSIDKVLLETSLISLYVAGICMVIFGFLDFSLGASVTSILLITMAIITCFFTQKFLISFLSASLFFASLFVLLVFEGSPELIHVFNTFVVLLYLSLSLLEGEVLAIHPRVNKLFGPVRIVLILALLYGVHMTFPSMMQYYKTSSAYFSSIPIIIALLIVVYPISKKLGVARIKDISATYCFVVPFLVLTASSPGISAAFLVLLVGVLTNHKTGVAIGVLSFLYFISRFYYDMNLDLLTKSYLLMGAGVIFMIVYLITRKNLISYEEV
jgi:hypothetical protein